MKNKGNKDTDQTAQICRLVSAFAFCMGTVMTLSFRTDRSRQTVQTKIRLLLEEQSDQGLHCLLFNLHLFDNIVEHTLRFGFFVRV